MILIRCSKARLGYLELQLLLATLGSLSNQDSDGGETLLNNRVRAVSNFIALPSRSICQMLRSFSGVEF